MQKATVKLLLKNNKKNMLGQFPIYLRITSNGKASFISTGKYIFKNQWDDKTESVKDNHKEYNSINLSIHKQKNEVLDQLLQAAIDKKFKSASSIKQIVADELKNVFKFSDKLIREVEHRRSKNTIKNYQKHFKKLKEYSGDKITFDEIDADFLRSFEAWLRSNVKNREGKDPNNYIAVIMRSIRSHFNEALSRGITNNYPFGKNKYTLPDETTGNKEFLSLAELKRWHEFTFTTQHEAYKESALYFLFACYTGLRISDWKVFTEAKLRQRNISVQATKNKAWVNVPLHDGLIEVIKLMKEIPLTVSDNTVNKHVNKIAEELKIKKHLSTHSGRKSFAVTMCLERGVSSETAAKLMGITLAVFEKNYSFISPAKIQLETSKAWDGLFK